MDLMLLFSQMYILHKFIIYYRGLKVLKIFDDNASFSSLSSLKLRQWGGKKVNDWYFTPNIFMFIFPTWHIFTRDIFLGRVWLWDQRQPEPLWPRAWSGQSRAARRASCFRWLSIICHPLIRNKHNLWLVVFTLIWSSLIVFRAT